MKTAIFVGVSTLVGCAASPPAPPAPPESSANSTPPKSGDTAPSPKQAEFESRQLKALRDLQIFGKTELIAGQPAETFNCYGPCSRLGKFVEAARATSVATPPPDACEQKTIDANLAAIEALRIVHVDGLLVEQPKTSPSCYNQPCAEDVEDAKKVTCARAGKLASLVAATRGL